MNGWATLSLLASAMRKRTLRMRECRRFALGGKGLHHGEAGCLKILSSLAMKCFWLVGKVNCLVYVLLC